MRVLWLLSAALSWAGPVQVRTPGVRPGPWTGALAAQPAVLVEVLGVTPELASPMQLEAFERVMHLTGYSPREWLAAEPERRVELLRQAVLPELELALAGPPDADNLRLLADLQWVPRLIEPGRREEALEAARAERTARARERVGAVVRPALGASGFSSLPELEEALRLYVPPEHVLRGIRFADARDMSKTAPGSAQLVVMGPPYLGVGKAARAADRELLRDSFREAVRALKPGGVIALMHADYKSSGELYLRHDAVREAAEAAGLRLVTHKVQVRTLRGDDIRQGYRHVQVFARRGPYFKQPTRTPEFYPDAWLHVKSQAVGGFKDGYAPESVEALIRHYTREGDLVLAPFAGSGTSVWAALSLGRRAEGYELDARREPVILERARALNAGEYRMRPLPLLEYVAETLLRGRLSPGERRELERMRRELKALSAAPRLYRVIHDGREFMSPVPGRYAGHRPGKVFGRLDCRSGMRMKAQNRVFFLTWADAARAGYRPCRNCRPGKYDHYPEHPHPILRVPERLALPVRP